MRFSAFLGLGSALVALAFACSSSDDANAPAATPPDGGTPTSDGGTTPEAGTTASVACANLAGAFCQKLGSCGSFSLQRRYTDMNECLTRQALQCTATAAAPDINRTVADSEQCAAAYTSADCADILSGNVPAACQATTHPGNRAIGASCAVPAQCQSGYCTAPRGQACGTCTAAGPAVGAICPESCDIGQYCNKQTNQCTLFGKVGDACDANLTCQPGLGCAGSVTNDAGVTQGQCQTPATIAGAPCDTSIPTGTPCASEDGLTCSKKLCVQGVTATTGEACGSTTPVLTFCAGGAECNNAPGAAGTCLGPVADGLPCDTSTDAACLPGSVCVGTSTGGKVVGTCQVRAAATCN